MPILKAVPQKKDPFGLGKAASSRQWIALVRAGEAQRHPKRQAFLADAGTASGKQNHTDQKQGCSQSGKKKQTHPRRKYAARLDVSEFECIRKALGRGTHVSVQALALLCFMVFQTSDVSFHMCRPQ